MLGVCGEMEGVDVSEEQQPMLESEEQPPQLDYERLLADKTEKLEELLKRKPGQKHYKQSLKAFLDADAKAQKALLRQLKGAPGKYPAGPIVKPH
jgi:hypothetical protein